MNAARPAIVLFLSTGRCGTQWLAEHLSLLYPHGARVTHEPIGPAYRARTFFRQPHRLDELASVPEVRGHLDGVRRVVEGGKTYIETGWPLFPAVPLFLREFGGRVAIVHLTRHPVPTSLSHMVHQCYGGSPRDDGYTRLAALDPFCPGVVQQALRDRWDALTPFEKCLFWWTEVHHYALELEERLDVAWLRVASEDLLDNESDEAVTRLVAFLGLDRADELAARRRIRVDRWHHRTDIGFDRRKVHAYPLAVETAARLGYDVDDVDDHDLADRYVGRPTPAPDANG